MFTAAVGFLPAWAWRWLAIIAACAALWGHGYVKGIHHQEAKDEAAFAQIRVAQDQQAIHAGQVALDRAATISAVVDSYEDERTRVARYYAGRLRDAATHQTPTALPADQLPKDTDWRSAYSGLATAYGQLGQQWKALDADDADIRARCAQTTVMYLKLREAVLKVENIK